MIDHWKSRLEKLLCSIERPCKGPLRATNLLIVVESRRVLVVVVGWRCGPDSRVTHRVTHFMAANRDSVCYFCDVSSVRGNFGMSEEVMVRAKENHV